MITLAITCSDHVKWIVNQSRVSEPALESDGRFQNGDTSSGIRCIRSVWPVSAELEPSPQASEIIPQPFSTANRHSNDSEMVSNHSPVAWSALGAIPQTGSAGLRTELGRSQPLLNSSVDIMNTNGFTSNFTSSIKRAFASVAHRQHLLPADIAGSSAAAASTKHGSVWLSCFPLTAAARHRHVKFLAVAIILVLVVRSGLSIAVATKNSKMQVNNIRTLTVSRTLFNVLLIDR